MIVGSQLSEARSGVHSLGPSWIIWPGQRRAACPHPTSSKEGALGINGN
jgi:hypothetical protein